MTYRVTISVINYRTVDLTIACAQSVLDDIGALSAHLVIVDNASGDGSAEQISAWIDSLPEKTPVTLVCSETNSGFSGGHNQGMGATKADYYLVLNSDAVLRPGFLHAILRVADANPQAGIIAPRIETDDGKVQVSQFRFHSPRSELIRAAATAQVTKLLQRHVVALDPPVDLVDVEWASFACILLKGEMVTALGPMDEGYFLYFEDAEYCLRARRAGWTLALAPAAVAVHFRGGSGPVKSQALARKRLPSYYYCSRSRFMTQRSGRLGLFCANINWHLGRLIAHARRLAGKDVPPAIEREARDIWINFMHPLKPEDSPR